MRGLCPWSQLADNCQDALKKGEAYVTTGKSSTKAFKAKDNPFLGRVRLESSALYIGSTSVGIPTVADDNCMISDLYIGAKPQLFMAQDNSSRVRYVFNTTKSKTR